MVFLLLVDDSVTRQLGTCLRSLLGVFHTLLGILSLS